MTLYAAFLRGVSPMNAKMPELKKCFEDAGFSEVRTLLSSGNVGLIEKTFGKDVTTRTWDTVKKVAG
jgi:uncharacterized protein (DUF1697 family)